MNRIEYSALNYYHTPVSDECMCLGVLFNNVTAGKQDFKHISNFRRFQAFDDEADINFVKAYLKGIIEDTKILGEDKDTFDLESYVRVFANEFKFSKVKKINAEDNEDYINNITKIYLKYDYPKSERLNASEEKRLIKRVFESNNLRYSNGKVRGKYDDEIPFDYKLNNLYVKHFSFKGKNLRRLISTARQWAFAAGETSCKKNVLFTYNTDFEDVENLNIITNILSENAQVLQMDDGIDYILKSQAN